MRRRAFPERVERHGVVATIYAPKDASKGYTVAYYVRGAFVRKVRNSYEKAKKLALGIVDQKANGKLDDAPLSREECLVFRRAAETVKPIGRPLDLAAHEYAQAVKLLGDESLVEAIKFYLANRTRAVKSRTVQEVVTELRENKQRNGRSKLYLTDLKLRLERFAAAFKCPIHTVEPADIQRFLNGLKVSGRTRNNFRRAIGTLFRFAKVRGYVPAHHSPDPWWLLRDDMCVVFEDHSNATPTTVLDVTKARQVATHPNWIREHLKLPEGAIVLPVLVTPVSKASRDAVTHLKDVSVWKIDEFREWAKVALRTVRELRREFPGTGDLAWRAVAAERLQKAGLDGNSIAGALVARTVDKVLSVG